ncbi:hypothetical protein V6N13_096115 [Hibiscus sabdariffa]
MLAILNLDVNSTQLLAPCIARPGCRFPMVDSCKLDQLENVAKAYGFGGCVSSKPLLGDVIYTSLSSVDVMGEDIRNMGLGSELNEELYEMIPCSNVGISWAKRVDMANGNTEAYAIESRAVGCGGVLCTSEGVICAMFSGPLPSLGADHADILVLRKVASV